MLTENLKTRRPGLGWRYKRQIAVHREPSGHAKIDRFVFLRKRRAPEQFIKEPTIRPEDNSGNNIAAEIASRVETMPVERVRERYHDLIDKRPNLTSTERFELERVKSRLDAEDFDATLEMRNRAWERRQKEVLDSIEDLLDRLRVSHFG